MLRCLALVSALVLGACTGRPEGERAVVIAYPSGPLSLVDFENEEITMSVLSNVYEGLVAMDENLVVRPALAESWHTPDDFTWVFRLKSGVRLHDGRPLDASLVAEALERLRTAPGSKHRGELTAVTAVEQKDPHTLVVKTRYPFGQLPNRLANVLLSFPRADGQPVGTGPFRIDRWTPGGDTVLRAFPEHWAGPPGVAGLEFRVVPDGERRLQLLQKGEVHLVVDVPPHKVAALGALPDVRLVSRKGLRVLMLGMDCAPAKPGAPPNPFQDARVRRALALAIDRASLVTGPLGGNAEALNQIIPPEVFGYDETLPPVPHDPAQSRALLAEAGLAQGVAVALDFMPRKYLAMDNVVARLMSDLAAVGIRVEERPQEPGAMFELIRNRRSALFLIGWMSDGGDAGLTYDYLVHTPGNGFGLDNAASYANAAVDDLLDTAAGLQRPEQRRPRLSRVAAILQEQVPFTPLYRQFDVYGAARTLEFQPRADRRLHGARMRWTASN